MKLICMRETGLWLLICATLPPCSALISSISPHPLHRQHLIPSHLLQVVLLLRHFWPLSSSPNGCFSSHLFLCLLFIAVFARPPLELGPAVLYLYHQLAFLACSGSQLKRSFLASSTIWLSLSLHHFTITGRRKYEPTHTCTLIHLCSNIIAHCIIKVWIQVYNEQWNKTHTPHISCYFCNTLFLFLMFSSGWCNHRLKC